MPFHTTETELRSLAYDQTEGRGPGVVFLGGFMSNKDGTKARHLENWAKAQSRAFLRFDYSGHGGSSGEFRDGSIGDWLSDAQAIIEGLTEGPQILVGSSMGGWIAFLLARRIPEKVAGLVTVAAAPDFLGANYMARITDTERASLSEQGFVEVPSEYDDGPYVITQRMIDDGDRHTILSEPLALDVPVRLLQGTEDTAVPMETALRLFKHIDGDDVRLSLVKEADHRFSTPDCLHQLETALQEVLARVPVQTTTL